MCGVAWCSVCDMAWHYTHSQNNLGCGRGTWNICSICSTWIMAFRIQWLNWFSWFAQTVVIDFVFSSFVSLIRFCGSCFYMPKKKTPKKNNNKQITFNLCNSERVLVHRETKKRKKFFFIHKSVLLIGYKELYWLAHMSIVLRNNRW